MSWEELVATALIGTERRPVHTTVPPGAPDALAEELARRAPEDRLLACAAAWTVARRAGARPGRPIAVTPAPADPRPLCSPAAAERLSALLEDGRRPLVGEWLELAGQRGLRPPPELVPDLLDYDRDPLVVEAAGPLGAWLAEREPRWAFARAGPAAVWADGDRLQRRAVLERLRRADPDAARELLACTFAEETWEDRAAFIDLLAVGLSDADEPFLEAALDDPRAAVRDAAAAQLAALPRSRLAARMAARAKPLLRVEDGTLAVTLPGPPDAAARRDGVPAGGGRAERLTAVLAATPLDSWDLSWTRLPVADDLADAVHAGWARAARRQRDRDWARALWPKDHSLLAVLGREEAERLAATAEDPYAAALELPWTWGTELSRAVLATVPARRERGRRVSAAGYRLDPALAAEADALRELGGRDVWELCDILDVRAAMLRELS